MRSRLACATLLGTLLLSPAHAGDLTFTGGAALKFAAGGDPDQRQNLNLHAEAGFSSFYAGASFDLYNASRANELGLSLGYRNTLANGMGLDLSYTRNFYPADRATYPHTMGNCCGDIEAVLSMPVGANLTASLDINYYPEDKRADVHAQVDYLMGDRLSLAAKVGRGRDWTGEDTTDWKVSAGYKLGESSTVKLNYFDSTTAAGYLGLDLTWDTTLLGG